MGKFQIYLPWLLDLGICKISRGTGLCIVVPAYRDSVTLRDATPIMYYLEQRVAIEPMFSNIRLNYTREYRRTITKDKYYKMDAEYAFQFTTNQGIECINKVFLEIQENRSNHTNQQCDTEKDMVIRSEGDDIIYFRIGKPYPEHPNQYTTHVWFYENHLRPKLITGLLQSSAQFRVDYCMHQFRLSVENEISRLTSDAQKQRKDRLESQLKRESKLFQELMKYSNDQILQTPDSEYMKATAPCVPIMNLIKIVSFGKLNKRFIEFARGVYETMDHKVAEDKSVLLSFRSSVIFLIKCIEFVEMSDIEYISMYLGSVQPIYTEMIELILNDSRMRMHNVLKYRDQANELLSMHSYVKSNEKMAKMKQRHEDVVLGFRSSEDVIKQRLNVYMNLLKKHNIEYDVDSVKKNKYELVKVLANHEVAPGESIVSGIPNFPLVKRPDSNQIIDSIPEFITDTEVAKILESYTNKSISSRLMKDIRREYVDDIPNRLLEVCRVRVGSGEETTETDATETDATETDSTEDSEDSEDSYDSDDEEIFDYFLNKR